VPPRSAPTRVPIRGWRWSRSAWNRGLVDRVTPYHVGFAGRATRSGH